MPSSATSVENKLVTSITIAELSLLKALRLKAIITGGWLARFTEYDTGKESAAVAANILLLNKILFPILSHLTT